MTGLEDTSLNVYMPRTETPPAYIIQQLHSIENKDRNDSRIDYHHILILLTHMLKLWLLSLKWVEQLFC